MGTIYQGYIPGQQFGDVADVAVSDPLEDLAQLNLRTHLVQFGRANERVVGRGALAARAGIDE
jgi:hypothetical protein